MLPPSRLESTARLWSAAALFLALVAPARAQDVVEEVITDAFGNIRVILDDQGNVLERHDYLPFGEECTTGPCAANPGVGAGQPRKFTGKERDQETGLDYFGARYYRAHTARFTTVDPYLDQSAALVDPQRWNRYAYGRNNPLRYVDPDGRDVFTQQEVFQTWGQYQSGEITLQQYQAHMDGIGRSGLLGIALFVPGPEDLVLGGLALRYGGFLGRIFGKSADDVLDVAISHRKSPRAAEHIDDAQAAGKPDVLTVDRGRTRPNRKESLKGTESQKGMDRDEYPPACCAEGGAGASVRPIPRGDNRSAGAQLGNQLRKVPDGTQIRVRTTDE